MANRVRGTGYRSRRDMLLRAGAGFGALALHGLSSQSSSASSVDGPRSAANPTGAPHVTPLAKNIIFVFLEGGPSHIDLFDPKPQLNKLAGQPLPASFGPIITPMGEYDAPLMASKRKWSRHGQSGLWFSDWIPHIAQCADDLTVIRSCWGNGLNHSNGVCQMNTGSILAGRPSLGAWVTYGLGTENTNLPAFVVIEDEAGKVINGPRNWSTAFMPAAYQGTPIGTGPEPIRYLKTPDSIGASRQHAKIQLLDEINRRYAEARPENSELEARIRSYELAFKMQTEAPEAVNFAEETQETLDLYGIDKKETEVFGRNCLLARRLVERGVRFVQLYHGAGSRWDAHTKIESNHSGLCKGSDQPVAGLIRDLKQRGLLDSTLVIWGGEFGRTPMSEKGDGRDHNPYGFTMFMAGGGVKGGQVVGSTDELGLHAVEDRLHVHDLHASILYLLGLDHWQLVYSNQGRPERATQNEGKVCRKLFA